MHSEGIRNSRLTSEEFCVSSGFLGFGSGGGDEASLPLPRQSNSSAADYIHGGVFGLGSGLGSISSVSLSGSSEDQPAAQEYGRVGQFRVRKRSQFIWNMSLVAQFTNYFKNMVRLGNLLFEIIPGRLFLGLPTCKESI